jgi:hypothetical protein
MGPSVLLLRLAARDSSLTSFSSPSAELCEIVRFRTMSKPVVISADSRFEDFEVTIIDLRRSRFA